MRCCATASNAVNFRKATAMVNDWKMWRQGEAARPPPARGSERPKFALLWRKCGMMTRTPRLEGKNAEAIRETD
jgi:hypothetical protein